MTNLLLPAKDQITLCFAHHAYDMKSIFDAGQPGIHSFQVDNHADLRARLPEADVLIVSGLWKNDLLSMAPRLKYLQSVSSGTNLYDLDAFRAGGIALASGAGVNMNAVSEHAMALMLSLSRRMALARDNQRNGIWRGEQRDPLYREDELAGKTALVVGLGNIGNRIARLARAFDMHVIGVRRNPDAGPGGAHEVHGFPDLKTLIPRADVVILCCPLTPETAKMIDRDALALFRPQAHLINVARGGCVDEPALIDALQSGALAAAGLDVTQQEPLAAGSPLWSMPNVVLTPHAAGETRAYERNVLDLLATNLDRLWAGDPDLKNRVA